MSTKTKRLSQLLFRRSSTNSGPTSKPNFITGRGGNTNNNYNFTSNKTSSSVSSKEDTEGDLVPCVVDSTPKPGSHVNFSDKPLRTRSSSPSRRNLNSKPVSILKNGSVKSKGSSRSSIGKTTLQRTKSNPNPLTGPSTVTPSGGTAPVVNPLQDVSWNCPTLEKRKEMILNYFKTFVLEPGAKHNPGKIAKEDVEPIYEEIGTARGNVDGVSGKNATAGNTDSLKPKIAPKRFRLNIPHVNDNESNLISGEPQPPIYDKVLTRSSSFNVYEDLQQYSNRGHTNTTAIITTTKETIIACSSKINNTTNNDTASGGGNNENGCTTNKSSSMGLAHFASQVAQHAKATRCNSFSLSSSSTTTKSKGRLSSSSSFSSNGSSSSSGHYDLLDASTCCEMDEIYARIDKRGKKVGTMTSRLLKRHSHQVNSGKNSGELKNTLEQSVLNGKLEQLTSKSTLKAADGGGGGGCEPEGKTQSQSVTLKQVSNNTREESESQPIRPPRANKANNVNPYVNNNNDEEEKGGGGCGWDDEGDVRVTAAATSLINSCNTRNNNSLVEKVLPEKDLKEFARDEVIHTQEEDYKEESRFIDLAHLFPPIKGNNNLKEDLKEGDISPEVDQGLKGQVPRIIVGEVVHELGEGGEFFGDRKGDKIIEKMDTVSGEVETNRLLEDQIETKESNTSGEISSERKFFWEEVSDPSVPSEESGKSAKSDSSGISTTSDLSDCASDSGGSARGEMTTMDYSNNNNSSGVKNEFIRQDSKFFDDDIDEDGGFESFQVQDDSNYEEDELNTGAFSPPSSSGSPDHTLGESENNRQRTFAQSQQNIPEKELKLKASSVLDLINAEISDLHMREMELKRKNRVADNKEGSEEDLAEGASSEGSQQGEEDDYSDSAVDVESYSTMSGSGSGNVTPAEQRHRDVGSPRSPISERGPSAVDEEEGHLVDVDVGVAEVQVDVHGGKVTSGGDEEQAKQQQGVKVRPIVEEEVKSIELNVTKETPIEREIRLVREREEEFRKLRNVSGTVVTTTTVKDEEVSHPQKEEEEEIAVVKTSVVSNSLASRTASVAKAQNLNSLPVTTTANSGGLSAPKDIQYEMATARLKKEIEESLMRERELFREGRLKTLSVNESVEEQVESVKSDDFENEQEESPKTEKPSESEELISTENNEHSLQGRRATAPLPKITTVTKTPEEVKTSTPISGIGSVRFFSPAGYASSNNSVSLVSPVTSPTTNPGVAPTYNSLSTSRALGGIQQSQTHSLPMNMAKPQFTSIERMILKGSFSFNKNSMSMDDQSGSRVQDEVRMAKFSRMPDPLQIVQRVESVEETEEREQVEVDKPRRKYVPATDKIQAELQEQVKREKELSQLRAKWKSTPDLSKSEDQNEENGVSDGEEGSTSGGKSQEAESLTKPSVLRRQMSSSTQKISVSGTPDDVSTSDVLRMNKPTVRRRQSALINQWEEMIKQQQQKNKN